MGKYYVIHVERDGVWVLAVCAVEVSVLMTLEFLHRVCDNICNYYLDHHTLSEAAVREQFVTIYQVLLIFLIPLIPRLSLSLSLNTLDSCWTR